MSPLYLPDRGGILQPDQPSSYDEDDCDMEDPFEPSLWMIVAVLSALLSSGAALGFLAAHYLL